MTYVRPSLEARDIPPRSVPIYLAGPMTGHEEDNHPAFNEAARMLRAHGLTIINPAEGFGGDRARPRPRYMRAAMHNLLQAHAIAMLPGWEESAGATLELAVATALGLPVYDYRDGFLVVRKETEAGVPHDVYDHC